MYPADPFPFKFSQQDFSLSDFSYPYGVLSFESFLSLSLGMMSLEAIC